MCYHVLAILLSLLLSGKPALLAINGSNCKENYNENTTGLLNSSQFLQPVEGSKPGTYDLCLEGQFVLWERDSTSHPQTETS